MNAEDPLEVAFKAWERAHHALAELRKQLPTDEGGLSAPSPEMVQVRQRIRAQEEVCQPLFENLAHIAAQLADVREDNELAARVARVMEDWRR